MRSRRRKSRLERSCCSPARAAPDHDDPRSSASSAISRAPPRTSRRRPPPEDDAILEPGLRSRSPHLRAFAATPEHIRAEKALAIEFAFMRRPPPCSATPNRGIEMKARSSTAGPRDRRDRAPSPTCGQLHRLPHLAIPTSVDERAGRSPTTKAGSARPLLRRWAAWPVGTIGPTGRMAIGGRPDRRGYRGRCARAGHQARARGVRCACGRAQARRG